MQYVEATSGIVRSVSMLLWRLRGWGMIVGVSVVCGTSVVGWTAGNEL